MPRPPKPLKLLELSGAYRADRHAPRRHVPKSEHPIGEPHPSMAEDELACWREFVSHAPAGVLSAGDRWALEALARLHAKSRREGLSGAELGHLRRGEPMGLPAPGRG